MITVEMKPVYMHENSIELYIQSLLISDKHITDLIKTGNATAKMVAFYELYTVATNRLLVKRFGKNHGLTHLWAGPMGAKEGKITITSAIVNKQYTEVKMLNRKRVLVKVTIDKENILSFIDKKPELKSKHLLEILGNE